MDKTALILGYGKKMESSRSKTAFVLGFSGQDGTFLTRLLLDKGYRVVALVRRVSTEPPRRVRGAFDFSGALASGQLVLEQGDLLSRASLDQIIIRWQPDEVYNLAAQSHVAVSFDQPEFTIEADFMGVVNLIGALEACHIGDWRLYQASTSEMFGNVIGGTILNENSPLRPNSPYAIAKTAAHYYCRMKREQGRFISCGILFNHESEIRGGDFVTQKIAKGAVNWLATKEPIRLGNLDSQRDWGYAGDYVEGMWRMLQVSVAGEFVLATGKANSIRKFAEMAFAVLGCELVSNQQEAEFEVLEVGGEPAVVIDPQFYRPNEVGFLLGDSTKAKKILGWRPTHNLQSLVKIMVK